MTLYSIILSKKVLKVKHILPIFMLHSYDLSIKKRPNKHLVAILEITAFLLIFFFKYQNINFKIYVLIFYFRIDRDNGFK